MGQIMISAKAVTEEDLRGIAEAVAEQPSVADDVMRQLEGAAVAKFTNYVSDGPGYQGDVFVVVWPGGPEIVDVLTRKTSGDLVAKIMDNNAPVADVWGEDDSFPRGDWAYEVSCNYTTLGYWDWVRERRAAESSGSA